MASPSPWSEPQLLSAYQMGQQLEDQRQTNGQPVTRRVRETKRVTRIAEGQAFICELEVELEETTGTPPPPREVPIKTTWIDRLFGGSR